MNTPKKDKPLKRWRDRRIDKAFPVEGEGMHTILHSQDHLVFLGAVVSSFAHLEECLRYFLAALLGSGDTQSAGIILDSVTSTRGRFQLIERLLQEAPHNATRSAAFDGALERFWRVNRKRNQYVHGLWHTAMESRRTFLSPTDGEGLAILEAREVKAREMEDFLNEISAVTREIMALGLFNLPSVSQRIKDNNRDRTSPTDS